MSLSDLGVLYAAAGVVCGAISLRRSRSYGRAALASALLAVCLWPLWMPVLLATNDARTHTPEPASGVAGRTEAALLEGHAAVRGTALEPLLPREAVDRILGELRRAAARHAELTALLERSSFRLETARARVAELERQGGSARALASARLHLDNVERLEGVRRRDAAALEELAELVAALRTQLVLARYAGSSPVGATDIVNEVHARVEALGATMDGPAPVLDT